MQQSFKAKRNTIIFRNPFNDKVIQSFTGKLTIKNQINNEVLIDKAIAQYYAYEFIQECKEKGMTLNGTYFMNGDIEMEIKRPRLAYEWQPTIFKVIYKVGSQKLDTFNHTFEALKELILDNQNGKLWLRDRSGNIIASAKGGPIYSNGEKLR